MASFYSVLSPTIFWKCDNWNTCDTIRMLSPAFSYLKLRWKLEFSRLVDKDGVRRVQINLVCLSEIENLSNTTINSEVKITGFSLSIQKQSYTYTSVCSEQCVWSNTLEYVKSYVGSKNLCFDINLTAGYLGQQLLMEEITKQLAMEEIPYVTKLTEDLEKFYNNKEHSDFELKCGQLSLPVHKVILSARCGYFAALFRSPMKETSEKYIEFKDINPEILQLVIRYLYIGNLPTLPIDSIHEVYAVADMFLLETLKSKCQSLMINSYLKEDQIKQEENDTKIQEKSRDNRRHDLFKKLLLSREWEMLSEECPDLVSELCKPILLGTVKI